MSGHGGGDPVKVIRAALFERRIRKEQPRMMKIFVEPDSHGDLRGIVPEKAVG